MKLCFLISACTICIPMYEGAGNVFVIGCVSEEGWCMDMLFLSTCVAEKQVEYIQTE